MRPHPVESFVVQAVKDEQLPQVIPGFQLGRAFIDKLLEQCPTVVSPAWQSEEALPFGNDDPYRDNWLSEFELRQPSPFHRRSFEVRHPDLPDIWEDEFGHHYSSMTAKGTNLQQPGTTQVSTDPESLTAYGLQDSSSMRRVLRASRLLRSNGIGTEYIVGVAEPKSLPWAETSNMPTEMEMVSIAEYKRRIVESHWQTLPDEERTSETLVNLSSQFERKTFYISVRAMDSSYRVQDFAHYLHAQKAVIDLTNQHLLAKDQVPFTQSWEDLSRFLHEVTIPKAAENLARMHALGLVHRFLTQQNVTALGSIVDLDSVCGAPLDLGDEPITAEALGDDLLLATRSVSEACELFDYFSENKFSAAKEFMRHYLETYLSTTESSRAESFTLLGKAVCSIVGSHANNVDIDGLDFLRDRQLTETIENSFLAEFVETCSAVDEGKLTEWVATKLPEYHEEIFTKMREVVPGIVWQLFTEFINELADPTFDVVSELLSTDHNQATAVKNLLKTALIDEAVMYATQDHLIGQAVAPLEVITDEELRTLVSDSLYFEADLSAYLGDWSESVVSELLTRLEPELREASVLDQPSRTFPDHAAYPLILSTPNKYLMETNDVSMAELVEFLGDNKDELVIEHMLPVSKHCLDIRLEITDDGSTVSEIIAEHSTDGIGAPSERTLSSLDYPVPKGNFLLFVEHKPDNTRRLRLHIKDFDLFQRLSASSDPAGILKSTLVDQQSLFDASDYFKSPERLNPVLTPHELAY